MAPIARPVKRDPRDAGAVRYRRQALEIRSYAGPLLDGDRPHRDLARLLDARDTLLEIGNGECPLVVLGVPHHAALGIDRIAEDRPQGGRVADENAVAYALVCLGALTERGVPARLVVAAHATDHDPNKDPESVYCQRALRGPRTTLLLECHGASQRAPHDLEVSAGRNGRARPLDFGRLLASALGPGFHVAAQTAPGHRSALLLDAQQSCEGSSVLRFPALRTRSLHAAEERGIGALHLEAKPRFRSRGDGTPALTASGVRLGRSLARTIEHYLAASA